MGLNYRQDQGIAVTVLTGAGYRTAGSIRGTVGRQIEITVETPIAPGSLVTMEWDDYLLLGQVQSSDAANRVLLVDVEHALANMPLLLERRQDWLNPSARETASEVTTL